MLSPCLRIVKRDAQLTRVGLRKRRASNGKVPRATSAGSFGVLARSVSCWPDNNRAPGKRERGNVWLNRHPWARRRSLVSCLEVPSKVMRDACLGNGVWSRAPAPRWPPQVASKAGLTNVGLTNAVSLRLAQRRCDHDPGRVSRDLAVTLTVPQGATAQTFLTRTTNPTEHH